VEVHRASIMQKLGTRSLAGLVRIALAAGLEA
jgi:FixJ family two-component response regulator